MDVSGAVRTVSPQLSLFSAELVPPEFDDLGGLLAAHGQSATGPDGSRLSILLTEPWRASALAAEGARRGVAAEVRPAPTHVAPGTVLLRTERCAALRTVADTWTRGAVKAVPADLVLGAGVLRVWLLAAGRAGPAGFLLGLDPHAPGTHQPLRAALARAGLAGVLVGVPSGWCAVRITGRRRLAHLAELVGGPPDGAEGWPAALR